MTRLDSHVNLVRNKMVIGVLLRALAWALFILGLVVALNLLIDRLLMYRLPRWDLFFWVGLGVAITAAIAWTIQRRPTRRQAAVAIDQRLGLAEKYSTALFVRSANPNPDPFTAAAIRDAEMTAQSVSVAKWFPVQFPRVGVATLAVIGATLAIAFFLPQFDLLGRKDIAKKPAEAAQDKAQAEANKLREKAIAEIDSAPPAIQEKESIKAARRELAGQFNKTVKEPEAIRRSALKAMEEMDALKQKIKDAQRFADARNELEPFKSVGKPTDENTPVGKVQSDIGKGDFEEAAKDLEKAVEKFDTLKPEEKKKAADDMQKLAQQLQNVANNPQQQQQLQQKLQQMGATPQQMQQLANAAQAAANGNPQAQQQVQQMANQIAQGINNNPNLTPQQQQQMAQSVQNMAKQMQGAANNQAAAQQMAQAAQQMAQAMQQQASGQGQAQANPAGQNNPQQAGATPPAQNGQGNQPGQPGAAQKQQMAQAKQQMQQQLQNLKQASEDAAAGGQQQVAQKGDGQSPGQSDDGTAEGQGAGAGEKGEGEGKGEGQGKFAQGDPQENQGGNGGGGPGVAAGGVRPKGVETPVGFKTETSTSEAHEKGKLVASSFVKSMSQKGTSKMDLVKVVEAAEKESTDEVEQDRIPRQAAKAVRGYFDDLKRGNDGK